MQATRQEVDLAYEWGAVIGKGRYGLVKKATKTDKPYEEYAVKFIEKSYNPLHQKMQKREVKCLSELKHENVVKLHCFCTDYKLDDMGKTQTN